MKLDEFKILRYLCENTNVELTQRDIATENDIALGKVNKILSEFIQTGFISSDYKLTDYGQDALEPYKVNNAIILAAGMSTRFAPISYEKPKGLISVKGEVMIERLIKQLQEVGISEVVLVVGYMMEKFLYLRDKYNVKLVVNNEFATKNTHSSIYVARDYLKNTYICCSDNYYPQNMFHKYEYRAFYCSVYLSGISYVERAFTFDKNNLIVDTNKPSNNQWIMYGHAYYDSSFSKLFKPILENYYGKVGVENMYWETIYAENVKSLPMWVQKCTPDEILEFDSMEELKVYDKDFIANNRIKIFDNIENVLKCDISDIKDVEIVTKGLNNRSFKFLCNGNYYIYRHPGINGSALIDRSKESKSLNTAKQLGIDNTLIYVNEHEGWKISKFFESTEDFDFSNKEHIKLLANKLKILHESKVNVGFGFDYHIESDKLVEYLRVIDSIAYQNASELQKKMEIIFDYLDKDKWQVSLCHNDIYEPNLLVNNDSLELIDWEFAGDSDIGFDICKLFSVLNPKESEIDEYLSFYYGRNTTIIEKKHLYACAAVIYYYWYIWGLFVSKNGNKATDYLIPWHDKIIDFYSKFTKLN